MKTIKIKINTCPKRYYRHGYQEKFNEKILQDVRKQKGSIAFKNYKFTLISSFLAQLSNQFYSLNNFLQKQIPIIQK